MRDCDFMSLPRSRADVLHEIHCEIERARVHSDKFANMHDAYAVILEELDEVWDITRQKKRDRDPVALRKELIQVAAMAVKAIESMENLTGGSV